MRFYVIDHKRLSIIPFCPVYCYQVNERLENMLSAFFKEEKETVQMKNGPSKQPVPTKPKDGEYEQHKSFLIDENLKKSFRMLEQFEETANEQADHGLTFPQQNVFVGKYILYYLINVCTKRLDFWSKLLHKMGLYKMSSHFYTNAD